MAIDKEVDRILTLLWNKIRERGFTQLEVQEKLGWGRSYISQLLTKQKSLRVEQVLMILEVIKVEPGDFYRELFQFPQSEVRLRSLEEYPDTRVGEPGPGPGMTVSAAVGPGGGFADEFFRNYRQVTGKLRGLIQLLVDKDLVTFEELAAAVSAPDSGAETLP